MIFGYAYPAYECFKTVEKNKPEIEQLRFWCQYWILVALLTVFERVGDTFISWLPMYSEAKLAFFIYLWFPKTRGTTYVYDSFFRPYIAKHEPDIDRNLMELKTRAGDMAILYFHKATTYGQTRVFEVLQYVASQSTTAARPSKGAGTRNPPVTNKAPQTEATQQQIQQAIPELPSQPPSHASSLPSPQKQPSVSRSSSTTSTQQQPPARTTSTGTSRQIPESAPSKDPPVPQAPTAAGQVEVTGATQSVAELIRQSSKTDAEEMVIDKPADSSSNGNTDPPPQETVMDEVIRVTRARLRRNRTVTKTN